jgi:hypothetical protein
MAFKRIVANSEEDLKTIMKDIMSWFKETKDYKVNFSKEKRKFLDDNKNIVEKDIDVIKVVDGANNKETSIKFVPMKEKGEMKVELGGEGEAAITGKISNQMKGKGKLKSYSKDKKVALKEALDKRIATVFFKYKGKSFPMDYKSTSMFSKFVDDLTSSGAFNSEDEVSDFMSSEEFDTYANKFNVEIDWAEYDPTPLELAPEKPINPQDMIPGRAPGDFDDSMPHRVTDIYEKLKKTGKITKSELKEILLFEFKK